MKAILCVGVSASGKTHFANKMRMQGWATISRDEIREWLYGEDKLSYTYTKGKEKAVTEFQNAFLTTIANQGGNVVIHDTNLNKGRREGFKERLKAMGYEVEEKFFHISYEEALRRDAKRNDSVGALVIGRQFSQLVEQRNTPDETPCYVFDMDGTLALMGKRSPYDWDKVDEDTPNEGVVGVFLNLQDSFTIYVVSGRMGTDSCRNKTEQWLKRHGLKPQGLFMRADGDMRKDTEVKKEIFEREFEGKHTILGWFDDRPSVCRQMRLLGVPVFQVADPYLEF